MPHTEREALGGVLHGMILVALLALNDLVSCRLKESGIGSFGSNEEVDFFASNDGIVMVLLIEKCISLES